MAEPKAPSGARMEVNPPRQFGAGAVLAVNGYGALLAIPLVLAVMVLSSLKLSMELLVVIPLLTVAVTLLLLPFGLGNTYVARKVRQAHPQPAAAGDDFIVQLTLAPRLRSGLVAMLEDADDLGRLSLGEQELVFAGDSVKLSVPYSQIKGLRRQNSGVRGLFIYGARMVLEVEGLDNWKQLQFAERSSWLLPLSRMTTRRLYRRLAAKIPTGRS